MRNWRRYILAGLCFGFLFCFLVVPIGLAIREGFLDEGQLTHKWLLHVFQYGPARQSLLNALKVAAATTAGVMLLGLPLALLNRYFTYPGKNLASALLLVPMILPPFVGALAIKHLLAAEGGAVNQLLQAIGLGRVNWLGSGFAGVVILEVLHLYPIMYLNASAALANVDPAMTEAARNLGASRWQTFWRVTLPLIRPGLFAGGTIVFIWSFTELGTPLIVNYDVLPVKIFRGFRELGNPPEVFSMVFVMLLASVILYALGRVLFGRAAGAMLGRGAAATARRAGPLATAGIWAAFGLVTLLAVMPHLGVLLKAFARQWGTTFPPQAYTLSHFKEVFTGQSTWNSIVNSFQYASLATVIDVVVGLAIAYLVVRLRVRGRGLLDALAMLPLAVPGLVIASGYMALTRRGGPLEGIGPWRDPTLILIIAYSVRRLPYVVRSISAGLQQTPETLEEAARNLGASPLKSLWRITVPLILANVLAGAVLAFSFAMLEVSDSLILAQTQNFYPITKQIYSLVDLGGAERAAALGTLGMLLLTATLILANLLLGKRLGAMFRV
jgi:iron(III) transport system permease protein